MIGGQRPGPSWFRAGEAQAHPRGVSGLTRDEATRETEACIRPRGALLCEHMFVPPSSPATQGTKRSWI